MHGGDRPKKADPGFSLLAIRCFCCYFPHPSFNPCGISCCFFFLSKPHNTFRNKLKRVLILVQMGGHIKYASPTNQPSNFFWLKDVRSQRVNEGCGKAKKRKKKGPPFGGLHRVRPNKNRKNNRNRNSVVSQPVPVQGIINCFFFTPSRVSFSGTQVPLAERAWEEFPHHIDRLSRI